MPVVYSCLLFLEREPRIYRENAKFRHNLSCIIWSFGGIVRSLQEKFFSTSATIYERLSFIAINVIHQSVIEWCH